MADSNNHTISSGNVCRFENHTQSASVEAQQGHAHDHGHTHDHSHEHGHTHEILDHPGRYPEREMPQYAGRDWKERAFTVGIGG
jgi:urease accessory protein